MSSNHFDRGKSDSPRVAALVATRNRPGFLAQRALPSVAMQIRRPDLLVVIDDSDLEYREPTRSVVNDLDLPGCRVVYLQNYRTRGLSGALNTGIDWLTRKNPDPESLFVAILDDDDAWEPNHLEVCLDCARETGADMVAPGILRHDPNLPDVHPQPSPDRLDAGQFLSRNRHIQGSNLFLRLSVLLHAGGFDEALPSTTDSDLCIRIADLGYVKYSSVRELTVHHYADGEGRSRLSDPASPARHAGIDGFYRKYRGRMSAEVEQEFRKTKKDFFGWEGPSPLALPAEAAVPAEAAAPVGDPPTSEEERLALLVGIIVDPGAPETVRPLLEDLSLLAEEPLACGLDVLLLENGSCREDSPLALPALVESFRRDRGLRVYLVPQERQVEDIRAGLLGEPSEHPGGRLSIGRARTVLHRYLYLLTRSLPYCVTWVLDDDMRLDNVVWRADGEGLRRERLDIAPHLLRLKRMGVPIVLGTNTGDPPVPFSSTIRTQMVDLYHNLASLGRLDPDGELPDRSDENAAHRRGRRDHYYDLSRSETDRLETPFWIEPARPGETVRETFTRIGSEAERILAGEAIFRPLVLDAPSDPVGQALPSILRGGNAFIFDSEALREMPDPTLEADGRETRRSEMISSILHRYHKGRSIRKAPIPVRQDRSTVAADRLDLDKLLDDVRGYALYSALHDLLQQRQEQRHRAGRGRERDDLDFTSRDMGFAIRRFRKYVAERTAAFTSSFHRVVGLVGTIRRILDDPDAWWSSHEPTRPAMERLQAFLCTVEREYGRDALAGFRERVGRIQDSEVRAFLQGLAGNIRTYGALDPELEQSVQPFLGSQRQEIARFQIQRLFGVDDLRPLGEGAEGIVFTDGSLVYKYFYYWKVRTPAVQRSFLQEQVGRWNGVSRLYPLLDLREEGIHAVIVYPFEESEPYRGGHGAGLLQLLRECRDLGVVSTNLHPKNLIVARTGLRYIDYGCDVRPLTEDLFDHMCRRAWLCWRWHHRPDLREVFKRSKTDRSMPELEGYDRFRAALDPPSALGSLETLIEERVLRERPSTLLDYGCGKGKLARRLATRGIRVTAHDPDPRLPAVWGASGQDGVAWVDRPQLDELLGRGEVFDAIVCSRVLCAVEDGAVYRSILSDLRRLARPGGTVLLALCNPFFTFGGPTPYQERRLPDGARDGDVFVWEKRLSGSGTTRRDVHRPFDRLRLDVARAGFRIEDLLETETVDLERFEKASDYLLLVLRPVGKEASHA